MNAGPGRPVLVVGLPRAGTTWVSAVLGRGAGSAPCHEPDNAKLWPGAVPATRAHGRFPVLVPGDRAPKYQRLWQTVLEGQERPLSGRERVVRQLWGQPSLEDLEAAAQGRPNLRLRMAGGAALAAGCLPGPSEPGIRVLKSVHSALSLEWLASTFSPRVVVVVRHPANILASWLELDLPDRSRNLHLEPLVAERYAKPWGLPPPPPGPLASTVWQLALLLSALEHAADRHPEWELVAHDEFCTDPELSFKALFDRLDLPWTDEAHDYLRHSNRPGRGFETAREASNLPDSWRHRLSEEQVAELKKVLPAFPLKRWSAADLI